MANGFSDSWWAQNDPGQQSIADQVAGLYQQYLGRAPESNDVVQQWINGTGGNLLAIQQGIANSQEAQTYANSQQNPPSTGQTFPQARGIAPGTRGPGVGPQTTVTGQPSATGMDPAAYKDPASMMSALLSQGVDPNSAISQVNSQFNLPVGSSYAWRAIPGAPGGGVVEAPGGGYYAPGPNGGAWGYNAGDSGGGGGGGQPASLSGLGYTPLAGYTPPQAPQYNPVNIAPLSAPAPVTLPTLQDLENTPGYQFALQQGLQGVQRNQIPGGLGGAAIKAAAQYSTGLADQTYQNAVNNALSLSSLNAGNALNAFTANTNATLGAGSLNLAGTNQQFQNTYQPSWQAYLSNVGQNQFGANYGLNLANLGLQAQNQYWGQGLAENQNAFNQYNTNQNTAFQQELALAALGYIGNPYA